jgi:two-component system nitrogen regulation sensor histidine kinase NtrY
VTTRSRGTGLGLAIVSKIMEDHGGKFYLSDRAEGGALAVLRFPTVKRDEVFAGAEILDSEA